MTIQLTDRCVHGSVVTVLQRFLYIIRIAKAQFNYLIGEPWNDMVDEESSFVINVWLLIAAFWVKISQYIFYGLNELYFSCYR